MTASVVDDLRDRKTLLACLRSDSDSAGSACQPLQKKDTLRGPQKASDRLISHMPLQRHADRVGRLAGRRPGAM
jgi:hypothetical protein